MKRSFRSTRVDYRLNSFPFHLYLLPFPPLSYTLLFGDGLSWCTDDDKRKIGHKSRGSKSHCRPESRPD